MKKERSPILVILCIFILLLFIIIPPVLRNCLPKEETVKENINLDKLTILSCQKTFSNELYIVTSKTKYRNNYIESNIINYQKITDPSTVTETDQTNTVSAINEFNAFKAFSNINIVESDTLSTVTIDNDTINNNPQSTELKNYFQELNGQKGFYESMGYTCNTMES